MITVNIITKDDIIYGFKVSDHAGYSESGTDIVCAAVSMLVVNTINSIASFTDDVINVDEDAANAIITCIFKNKPSKDAKLLIDSMILGLSETEKQYGNQYIKVIK